MWKQSQTPFTLTDTCTLTSSSVTHSTDTFYGILCSGLTAKTSLSFISSNSSFVECVRKQSTLTHHSFVNSECVPDNMECWSGATFVTANKTTFPFSTKGDYDFSFCVWDGCSTTSSGGGICCSVTGSTLSVADSIFCLCSGSVDGGGAYISGASSISFERCSFLYCSALSTGVENGGGGICGKGITNDVWISSSFFFSGNVNDDGAGILLASCKSQQSLFCCSCRYVCGRTLQTSSSGGGGFRFTRHSPTPSISNCLLAFNEGLTRAGGCDIDVTKTDCANLIRFCFFYTNTAPHGSDLCLYCGDGDPGTNPFVHSFTLGSQRASVSYTLTFSSFYDYNTDWLPQGSIYFLNSSSVRGYDNIDGNTETWINSFTHTCYIFY